MREKIFVNLWFASILTSCVAAGPVLTDQCKPGSRDLFIRPTHQENEALEIKAIAESRGRLARDMGALHVRPERGGPIVFRDNVEACEFDGSGRADVDDCAKYFAVKSPGGGAYVLIEGSFFERWTNFLINMESGESINFPWADVDFDPSETQMLVVENPSAPPGRSRATILLLAPSRPLETFQRDFEDAPTRFHSETTLVEGRYVAWRGGRFELCFK